MLAEWRMATAPLAAKPNGSSLNIKASNIMFYEIVRHDNQGVDQECFREVKRLVGRGWFRKAIEYLLQWDNGSENFATAKYWNRVWDTPTDSLERSDREIYTSSDGFYHLCMADPSINGGYEAYYLSTAVPAEYFD